MRLSPFYALFFVIAILVLSQPCQAGVIDFAENAINSGNIANLKNAALQLQDYIDKHPRNAEAHGISARIYMKLRNSRSVKYHYREMIKKGGSPALVLSEYKKLIASLINTTRPNYDMPFQFIGDIASLLSGKHPYDATSEYIKLGNHAAKNNYPGMAAKCFGKAKENDLTDDQRQKIGNGYLWLAANGFQTERMKKLATPLVGEEKIKQVWPGEQIKEIFSKIYDDSHIDVKTGNIEVYFNCSVNKGDILEVLAAIEGQDTFNAEEVYIWKGKNFDPQWFTTKNGKLTYPIEVSSQNGGQTIWIDPGKNIKARVRVLRKYTPKPNLSLISITN